MRNIEKQASIGEDIIKRRPALDLTAAEMMELNRIANETDVLNALFVAYLAGLASGIRNARPTDPENVASIEFLFTGEKRNQKRP